MKKIYISLSLFLLILIAIAGYFYKKIYSPQLKEQTTLYIKSDDTLDRVFEQLTPFCNKAEHLKFVAKLKKFKQPKAGKYVLEAKWNSNKIINHLRSGKQTPVKVTFNNQNDLESLAGRLSHQIEADSIALLQSLSDSSYLKEKGLNQQTAITLYPPYTYDCYWNISPNQMRRKMTNAQERFWNNKRQEKAKKLNLNPTEVTILASIVHQETAHVPERPKVAGVYLNRLKRGIPLQADPTVIFAIKQIKGQDFVIKRVLTKDLQTKSTYNTYLHKGLPPGPIAMPDINAIDAVLNAEKHNYIYFCASVEKFGTHAFAKTLSQHNHNARVYQNWLNKQNTYR